MPLFATTLAAAVLASAQAHDPRSQPSGMEHAVLSVGYDYGPVAAIGDIDGDGLSELVLQSDGELVVCQGGTGGHRAKLGRPDALTFHGRLGGCAHWTADNDVDRDGLQDVALITKREAQSLVRVVSTRTAWTIFEAPLGDSEPRGLAWVHATDPDTAPTLVVASEAGLWAFNGTTHQLAWQTTSAMGFGSIARLQNVGDRNRDGIDDLLIDDGFRGGRDQRWFSGKDGSALAGQPATGVVLTALGDLDGDGLTDFAEQRPSIAGDALDRFMLRISGPAHPWTEAPYPRALLSEATVMPVGDVDGDGVPDIAVGDTNFHILGGGDASAVGDGLDLQSLTLAAAVELVSRPQSVSAESGCVHVRSGATGAVLMGVWGAPGTHFGVGSYVCDVGDQNGDGLPDIGVRTSNGLDIFPSASLSSSPFDWLAGRWSEDSANGAKSDFGELVVLHAKGGSSMPGIARTVPRGPDAAGSVSFLRLEREEGRFVLYLTRAGLPEERLPATAVASQRIVFGTESLAIEFVRIGHTLITTLPFEDGRRRRLGRL